MPPKVAKVPDQSWAFLQEQLNICLQAPGSSLYEKSRSGSTRGDLVSEQCWPMLSPQPPQNRGALMKANCMALIKME